MGKFISAICLFLLTHSFVAFCQDLKTHISIQEYAKPFKKLEFCQLHNLKNQYNEFLNLHAQAEVNANIFYNELSSEKYGLPKETLKIFDPANSNISPKLRDEILKEALFPKVIRTSAHCGKNYCLLINSQIWCAGPNTWGQLGNGCSEPGEFYSTPSLVIGLPSMKDVVLSSGRVLALAEDGGLWSFGGDHFGELGRECGPNYWTGLPGLVQFGQLDRKRNSHSEVENNFELPALDTHIVGIATGHSHSLILLDDGSVWAWGNNNSYELGAPKKRNRSFSASPIRVKIDQKVKLIAAGSSSSFAVTEADEILAWGYGSDGLFGTGFPNQLKNPTKIAHIPGIVRIVIASNEELWSKFVVVLDQTGKIWVFGDPEPKQFFPYQHSDGPTLLKGLPRINNIFAGSGSIFAQDENGQVWGLGKWARYFDRSQANDFRPMPSLSGIDQIEINRDQLLYSLHGDLYQFVVTQACKVAL